MADRSDTEDSDRSMTSNRAAAGGHMPAVVPLRTRRRLGNDEAALLGHGIADIGSSLPVMHRNRLRITYLGMFAVRHCRVGKHEKPKREET